jgi:hypothetical protein
LPLCAGGECARPLEDCGGIQDYLKFVQVMADPDDPEHEHLAKWLGAPTWDPKVTDSIETNSRLAVIKF